MVWAAIQQMVSHEQDAAVIEALLMRVPSLARHSTVATWAFLLELVLRNSHSVRLQVLRSARGLPGPPSEFVDTLRQVVVDDRDCRLRAEALRQLVMLHPEPHWLRELLRERKITDIDASIRPFAAIGLRDRSTGAPRTTEEWNRFCSIE